MADSKVIVVLHSLALEDPIPHRSLTFSAASDRVEIGRASKRENKNLAPSLHNALFDSRVMSRTHAVLHVSFEKKVVYIRDPGSMHGTWLNKEKIPFDNDIALSDGDELTFGVEVVRACDTFPPLRVRCECRWLETPKETVQRAQHQAATNTFSVPDDDYDDVEYLGNSLPGRPAAIDLTTDQTSDSSAWSDWGDSHSVAEVPSPMTSPAKNVESKAAQPLDTSTTLKQDMPQKVKLRNEKAVNSEQPLATPRTTPPSVDHDSEDLGSGDDQYYDEYFAHSSDEDPNVEPEGWTVEAEAEDEEEEQEEQEQEEELEEEEEEQEEEDDDDDGDEEEKAMQDEHQQQQDEVVEMSALLNPVPGCLRLDDIQVSNDSTLNIAKTASNPKQTPLNEGRDAPRMDNTASDHRGLPDPSRVVPAASNNLWPKNKLPSTVSQREVPDNSSYFPTGPLQSSFADDEVQRLRFYSSGQLPGHFSSHTNPTLLPPILQKQLPPVRYSLDAMPFQTPYLMSTPYNDGPFATSRPVARVASPQANTSSSSSKPDIMPFMDSLAPMMPGTSSDATQNLTTNISSKKRKASEIDSEAAEHDHQESGITSGPETQQTLNKNDDLPDADLPDAQPQTVAALLNAESYVLDGSDSQLTTVSVPENSKEAKESERPSKMVKTSHRGSIRSHAATAIFGAVVGAVGTIAALASLPPDYFA
ncbi:hypothetical protein BDW72DRAFT_191435 [Aspergillus terricola var. indicus]